MSDDAELLRRYAADRAEDAFAELVRRHLTLVYSAALRTVGGDAHLAEDVTQLVFTALARKAPALAGRRGLAGWLHTSTRFAAAKLVRAEQRRRVREQKAQTMQEILHDSGPHPDWERIRPVLDAALGELGELDREAVLLRFFEGRALAEVGTRLALTETAARSRVDRALDRLRALLERRGVTSTSAALGLALANQAGVAAPAGLAASVTGAALAGAGTAAGVGGWVATFMSIGKIQAGIVSVIAVAGTTAYMVQGKTNTTLRAEIAALQGRPEAVAALREENRQLAATAAEVELLRHDDVELQQLAQSVAEVKKQNEDAARLAQTRAVQDRRKELEKWIQEQDRLAQVEIERMNKEGNALVVEYKELTLRAKDLTGEARTQADAAAKTKIGEIQAKQREIKAFIEKARQTLASSAEMTELRSLSPVGSETIDPAKPVSEWKLGSPSGGTLRLNGDAPTRDWTPASVPGVIGARPQP